jgi:hypothetical protein
MTSTTDLRATKAALSALPIFGGTAPTSDAQYGIVTTGELLINQLADGADLNGVWTEFRDLLAIWNTDRNSIASLLAFKTTATGEAVPQNVVVPSFERASELGVPKSANLPGDSLLVGFDQYDYDLAGRLTARFLRDADLRQVESVMNGILAADSKLVTGRILRRLMDPDESHNEHGHRVFGLYNGTDGITPPPYMGRTFSPDESHYITSGADELDALDVEDAVKLVTRKGFGTQPGSQMLIIANDDEADAIMKWRAGEPSRTGGPDASFDFVPSKYAPVYTSEKFIIGELAPADYFGIPVLGSYGESWLLRTPFVPSGYVVVVASYGPNSC